jgi:Uncharacterized conserved protein
MLQKDIKISLYEARFLGKHGLIYMPDDFIVRWKWHSSSPGPKPGTGCNHLSAGKKAMTASTFRQRAVNKALTVLLPQAPYADIERIRALANDRKLRALPPSVAVWLATVAHVRHVHTDYDTLLEEGYDRDSARFFVVDEINAVLTRWRATRLLDPDEDETSVSISLLENRHG